MQETTRDVRITWVLKGTNESAAFGNDETVRTDWTLDECREAAEYHAECDGVDLERYECVVEEVDPRPAPEPTVFVVVDRVTRDCVRTFGPFTGRLTPLTYASRAAAEAQAARLGADRYVVEGYPKAE